LKDRKNGNFYYHEILSIDIKDGVDRIKAKESLHDIASEFVRHRCSNNLAFGCIHEDHEGHLHYHFMISANEVGEKKRQYLTTSQFRKLKVTCEDYAHEHHAHLKQDLLQYRSDGEDAAQAQDELAEEKQRPKQTKAQFTEIVEADLYAAMNQTSSMENFIFFLEERDYEFKVRGKTYSVHQTMDDGKKQRYRLKGETLERFNLFSELVTRPVEELGVKEKENAEVIQEEAVEETHQEVPTQEDEQSDKAAFASDKAAEIGDLVRQSIAESSSMEDLHYKLDSHGLELYVRGSNYGVQHISASGKVIKHRLSTLGLHDEFEVFSATAKRSDTSEIEDVNTQKAQEEAQSQRSSEQPATKSREQKKTSQAESRTKQTEAEPDQQIKKKKSLKSRMKDTSMKLKDVAGWRANYKDKAKPKTATQEDVSNATQKARKETSEQLRREFENLSKKQSKQSQKDSPKNKM
jgi:hypothetical protein